MTGAPRAAVVVVSFETRDVLLAGLATLGRDAGIPIEVVVVDNASSDGSADAVRSSCPDVQLIANPENLGFAHASNQGARATRAPLILFLNPDASPEPGAIATLASFVESRPRVGIAGPRLRSANGDIQPSTGGDLSLVSEWRQRRLVRGVARRDPRLLAEAEARLAREHQPDWVSGACLMARREAFEAVGGFDEAFFLYEEDADLCRRVRAAGWQVVFTPSAEARHALGRSMARAASRARLEYHRSHLRYYRKHCGFFERTALRGWLLVRSLLGLASALGSASRARRLEAAALLRLSLTGS